MSPVRRSYDARVRTTTGTEDYANAESDNELPPPLYIGDGSVFRDVIENLENTNVCNKTTHCLLFDESLFPQEKYV